ncbi:hypothetical protein CAPTEDRAFT_189334, partial [Capitella teleta]
IQQCRSIVENETHLVGGIDRKDAKRALYDVCWLALKGSLKVEQTVGALTEVMELHDELSSVLADVLGVLGAMGFLRPLPMQYDLLQRGERISRGVPIVVLCVVVLDCVFPR